MFEFSNPHWLWLLLGVPALVWAWLRQRNGSLRYPCTRMLAKLPAGRLRLARWLKAAMLGLAFVLLPVALAGPRWADPGTRLRVEGIAICMVVDVSGSMAEKDFDWNGERITRLEAVKKAFRLFVQGDQSRTNPQLAGRPDDLIGLVVFATRPNCVCPLTLDHSALLKLLDAEQPRSVPGESETNIIDALVIGLDRLSKGGPRRKVLIVLSDGEHNVPQPLSKWSLSLVAGVAAKMSIPIYAIDAGNEEGNKRERQSELAATPDARKSGIETMKKLAHDTDGRYFQAHDTRTLLEVCQTIDRLERTEIESYRYRHYYEGYPWFGLGAFVLLVLTLGLEKTVWLKVP